MFSHSFTEYLKRLVFPRSVTVGNGKVLRFEEGEENKFFDTLVESKECSFMWRGCVDIVAMCNMTQLKVDIDIFDPATGKVVERQSYEPDTDFPWLEEDANKPSKLFSNQNIGKMKMINYKDSHFNLIIEKDNLLLSKTNLQKEVMNDNCNICQKSIEVNSTINDHIKKYHKEEMKKCEALPKENSIETLKKKVKLLESQLRDSEEKRKKSIIDQHEAEYATKKIKSEHERLKIEYSCLNNLLDLEKSKNEAKSHSKVSSPKPAPRKVKQNKSPSPPIEQGPVEQSAFVAQTLHFSTVPERSPASPQHPRSMQEPQLQQQQQQQPQQKQQQDPQVQLQDPHLQEPQLQDPQLRGPHSILQAYRSYKEALHSSKKSEEIIFNCAECDYPFRSKEELSIHTDRHNQSHCTKCNTDFKTKLDLKFHINYENNCERQWNCKECGYQGNDPSLLKTHINETHTAPIEVSFPCSMCSEVFNTKWYFMNHIEGQSC